MPRLFTGLEIPAEVGQVLSFLRGGLPGARWIDPQNYHLTLRFIGDVDDAVAHEIASMLGRVRRQPFELRLEGLSSFGGRKPRAVFAEVPPTPTLLDLQAEHERLLQRVGLEPEGRKFTPHVTLARLRDSSSRDVADYLSERGSFRSPAFHIGRFVLFSSRASVGGGPYVIEEAYPLEDAAWRVRAG
jgi:2'-5' RNA ligase